MPPYGWILLICAAVFVAAVALYLFLIKPASTRGMDLAKYGTKFAHRGLWDAQSPENSLSAFQKAVDAGYGIEFDIHKTKDGQVVTNGGRVIAVSSYGDTQLEALATSFKNAQALHFTDMYCRSDIGKDIL